MPKFAVVVPVYNRVDLTINFLKNIIPHINDGEIIIVDNHSQDDVSTAINILQKFYMQRLYKNVPIMLNVLDKNYGFGIANNVGAKLLVSDYVFFTSNDVIIKGDCFTPVLCVLEQEDCLVGETLYTIDTGWNTFHPVGTIPYLAGHFLATRTDTFFELGGWDENLFIDFEDLDLSIRYKNSGRELREVKVPLQHLFGQTASTQLPEGRLKHTLESQKYLMNKYGWSK